MAKPVDHARAAKPVGDARAAKPVDHARAAKPMDDACAAKPVDHARAAKPVGDARAAKPVDHARAAKPVDDARAAKPVGDARAAKPVDHARAAKPMDDACAAKPVDDARAAKPVNHARASSPPLPGEAPRAGPPPLAAEDARAGFTLIELLAAMMVASLAIGAISVAFRAPSPGTQLKTLAHVTASRLRDLRASAMAGRTERMATIDTARRMIGFGDARAPLALQRGVAVSVVAADDEMAAPARASIRFYPNGSSSGATITFRSGGQGYEVRVNWLTGRVSTSALR